MEECQVGAVLSLYYTFLQVAEISGYYVGSKSILFDDHNYDTFLITIPNSNSKWNRL